MDEDYVRLLTRLEVKVENVENAVSELKAVIQPVKSPILPVTGGVTGFLSMVYMAYLQGSGKA